MSRLPYHPQYVRSRTRFDAELAEPLSFGSEPVQQDSLSLLGSQPGAGSIAHARLLTALDSSTSKPGEKVEAVLDAPVYSADWKLVLPEGAHIDGSVVLARRARWFHRPGNLRFNFQNVDLTQVAQLRTPREGAPSPPVEPAAPVAEKTLHFRTQAQLSAAESANAPVKVDQEGGVQATESKTRFLAAAAAVLVARAAGDNDPIRAPGHGPIIGQSSNVGGRTVGGGLGFGLLGTLAAQSSRNVGAALGYYGLACALFHTLIARGREVQFDKNASIDIGFNTRSEAVETRPGSGKAVPAK
jgi:hypothetical protein